MTQAALMLLAALVVAGATALWTWREHLHSRPRAAVRANSTVLAMRRRVLEAVATVRPDQRRPSHGPAGRTAHRGLTSQR